MYHLFVIFGSYEFIWDI